jgi:mycofactocin biosynthetic radical S-adenosylmethionine protein MftC
MKSRAAGVFFGSLTATAAARRLPEGATFELTYGCNLRCLHCYNPTHRVSPRELSTEEVCAILDQMADFGVLHVTFTGGEPAIRPDIAHILQHARARGLIMQLLTNATRVTSAFAALLRTAGVAHVTVSIYGATAPVYEQMTGVAGSYDQFVAGLRCLADASLSVAVRMPVTTINRDEVAACRALVERHGLKFQYCLDLMPRTDGETSPLRYRLSPEDKRLIDDSFMPFRSPDPADSCHDLIACACGRSRFAVTPYGEMNLCAAFPIPKYDLRHGTVRDGWERLKQAVDQAQPSDRYACPSCDVRPFCRQGAADAWLETGDMSACLPHFKEWAELEHRAHALLDPRRPA